MNFKTALTKNTTKKLLLLFVALAFFATSQESTGENRCASTIINAAVATPATKTLRAEVTEQDNEPDMPIMPISRMLILQ